MLYTYRFHVHPSDPVIVQVKRQLVDGETAFIETTKGEGSINIASASALDAFGAGTTIVTKEGYKHRQDLPESAGGPENEYHQFSCTGVSLLVQIVGMSEVQPIKYSFWEPYYP